MNPKVDFYFTKANTWKKELKKLRTIIPDGGLKLSKTWESSVEKSIPQIMKGKGLDD